MIFIMLILTATSGCMTYTNLNTKQVDTFKEEIKTAYKGLKKISIKYSEPSLYFEYFIGISKVIQNLFRTKSLCFRQCYKYL